MKMLFIIFLILLNIKLKGNYYILLLIGVGLNILNSIIYFQLYYTPYFILIRYILYMIFFVNYALKEDI